MRLFVFALLFMRQRDNWSRQISTNGYGPVWVKVKAPGIGPEVRVVTLFLTLSPNGRGQQLAGLLHRDKPGRGALRRGVLQGVPRTGVLCVRLCRPQGVGFLWGMRKKEGDPQKCEAPVAFFCDWRVNLPMLSLEFAGAAGQTCKCTGCFGRRELWRSPFVSGSVHGLLAWRLGSVASGFCHVDRGWALGIPSRACSWRRPRRFSPDGSPRRWEECENPQKRLAGFGGWTRIAA